MKIKILVAVVMLLLGNIVFAQPPMPNHGSKNNAEVKEGEIQTKGGPLGTSTTLLITLGILATGYRINKNKKK